jgi:hypothetical protein
MHSFFESSWFDYPVTRNISLPSAALRHFNIAVLVFGVIYSIIITVINVALVGYEVVPVISGTFTLPGLWYEKFLPKNNSIVEAHLVCSPSIVRIGEGRLPWASC